MICTGGQLRPPVLVYACRRRGGQDGRKDCDTPGGGGGYSRHSRAVPPAGQRFGSDAAGVFLRGPAGGGRDPARPSVPTTRISCWRSAAAQLSALRWSATRAGRRSSAAFCPTAMRGWKIWPWTRPCAAGRRQRAFGRRQALGTQPALEYLELNVLAQNENAIRLYESQDFVEATKVMRCIL